jgi:hypothetical protein
MRRRPKSSLKSAADSAETSRTHCAPRRACAAGAAGGHRTRTSATRARRSGQRAASRLNSSTVAFFGDWLVNNGARWIFTSYNFVFRYLAWFYLVVFYLINQMLELLMISYLLMKNKNE